MDNLSNPVNQVRSLQLLVCAGILLNLSGLFTTIIGPDGTLYATIAKEMVQRNNYIELFARGADWLDKPHLPFWVTAAFFKVFGFTTWAYKLPGILFLFMGAWYTYAFAREFYNRQVALWAVIILLTAQHIVISNYDVRAEGYLTGCIIAAVYYYYKASAAKKFSSLLWGSLFTALGIMTKGIFAVIPIAGAIGGGLLLQKKWKEVFHWRWLAAALLVLLFIIPELYCLYYQFDLHPEKVVFDRQNVSGIRFFFWDSQFGRFFNTGPIKGSGDIFFFVHTTLWAFLPWTLLLGFAGFRYVRSLRKNAAGYEWYTLSGSFLTFVVFSLSRFQLPHYMNIVFPFFAILTAGGITRESLPKFLRIAQNVLLGIVCLAPVLLYILYASINWFLLIFLILLFSSLAFGIPGGIPQRLMIKTALVSISLNLFLNWYFYPSILQYQSASEAAFFANKNYSEFPIVQVNGYYSPLEFYAKQRVYNSDSSLEQASARPYLVYVATADVPSLSKSIGYVRIQKFDDFRISRMSLKFINKARRKEAVSEYQLLLVR